MSHTIYIADDNDNEYEVEVDVDYSCSPMEYEAGCYFGGGVEVESMATILSVFGGEGPPPPEYLVVGNKIELSKDQIESIAESIYDSIVAEEGRYPRMNISPDW